MSFVSSFSIYPFLFLFSSLQHHRFAYQYHIIFPGKKPIDSTSYLLLWPLLCCCCRRCSCSCCSCSAFSAIGAVKTWTKVLVWGATFSNFSPTVTRRCRSICTRLVGVSPGHTTVWNSFSVHQCAQVYVRQPWSHRHQARKIENDIELGYPSCSNEFRSCCLHVWNSSSFFQCALHFFVVFVITAASFFSSVSFLICCSFWKDSVCHHADNGAGSGLAGMPVPLQVVLLLQTKLCLQV